MPCSRVLTPSRTSIRIRLLISIRVYVLTIRVPPFCLPATSPCTFARFVAATHLPYSGANISNVLYNVRGCTTELECANGTPRSIYGSIWFLVQLNWSEQMEFQVVFAVFEWLPHFLIVKNKTCLTVWGCRNKPEDPLSFELHNFFQNKQIFIVLQK